MENNNTIQPMFYNFKNFIKHEIFYIGVNFGRWCMSYDKNDIIILFKTVSKEDKPELMKMKDSLQKVYNDFVDYKSKEVKFKESLWKSNIEQFNVDNSTKPNLQSLVLEHDPYTVLLSIAARRFSVIKGTKIVDVENI